MRKVVLDYKQGKILAPDIKLTENLTDTIKEVFFNPEVLDPESKLVQAICPPQRFPWDSEGKRHAKLTDYTS